MELGENTIINEARNFGITTPIPPYPSIFIGSADVYPMEMVAAYAPFANQGIRATPNAILRVENARQEVLWQQTPSRTTVTVAGRSVDHGRHDEGRRAARHRRGNRWGARVPHCPLAERPERRTTAPTSGSSGTPRIWSPASGSGSTSRRRSRPMRRADSLAAPAWTQFMTEVYRRQAGSARTGRGRHRSSRARSTSRRAFCRRRIVRAMSCGSEVYIPGTEPTRECDRHLGFGYDSLGVGAPPPSYTPPPPVSGGTRIIPGASPTPRRSTDTTRFRPDTSRLPDSLAPRLR